MSRPGATEIGRASQGHGRSEQGAEEVFLKFPASKDGGMDEKMKTEVVPVINPWRAGALSGQSIRGGCDRGTRAGNPGYNEGAEKSSRAKKDSL